MPATIKIKNSSTSGAVPTASDLVQGELAVNVADLGLYTENASGTVVKLNAPSIDDKNTGATKHLTISTGGVLGLGATPSSWDTLKALDAGSGGALWGTAAQVGIGSNVYYGTSNFRYKATNVAAALQVDGNVFKFLTAASGTAGNAITFTQAMTLDSSGNLLVGTTSSGSRRLYVAGSNAGYITSTENTNASPFGLQIYYSAAAPNGTSNQFIECVDSSATRFRVLSNGNAQNTNNSYGAISDIKLKENITNATPKLAQLNQVRVVNYNLIGDANKQLGVIAQELEQIFPGMVEDTLDYEEVTVTDEEGNETTERVATGTTTKSVKYSVFVPMLIKALQEQQAIISSLTARIEALEA